jgi:hypothetical protein
MSSILDQAEAPQPSPPKPAQPKPLDNSRNRDKDLARVNKIARQVGKKK